MNRSDMFMHLINLKPWTDYEWAKKTDLTRTTIGNNRRNNGKKIRNNTLEAMANACGYKLIQINPFDVRPNSFEAKFELTKNDNDYTSLLEENERLKKENSMLREMLSEQKTLI